MFVSSHNILLLLSPSGTIPQARLLGDGKTFGILTRTIGGIILSHGFMPLLSCVTGSFAGVTWNLERAGPRNLASVPRLLGFWKLFGIVLRAAVLFLFLQFAWDAYVISLFLEYFIIGCRVIQDFGLCKLDDLWRHVVDTKWCKITKYGISANTKSTGLKFCRVDVLQELHILIIVMMSP